MSGVPDVVGPVEAWRVFKIDALGVLTSPQQRVEWTADWMDAVCTRRDEVQEITVRWRQNAAWDDLLNELEQYRDLIEHDVPCKPCMCGFYALKDWRTAVARGFHSTAWEHYLLVLGKVEIDGRFIEGDDGWRAQRMRIRALVARSGGLRLRVVKAARRYQVPVVVGRAAAVVEQKMAAAQRDMLGRRREWHPSSGSQLHRIIESEMRPMWTKPPWLLSSGVTVVDGVDGLDV